MKTPMDFEYDPEDLQSLLIKMNNVAGRDWLPAVYDIPDEELMCVSCGQYFNWKRMTFHKGRYYCSISCREGPYLVIP